MGLREKDVALAVVMIIAAQVADICEVRFTRKDDTFIPLGTRAKLANDAGAKLFVSVHCNSAENRSANGFEVFTTPGETESDKLAIETFRSYASSFPHLRKRMDTADGDEDKEASFAVLRLTRCPAILFELEFISNEAGEAFLGGRGNQVTMATAIARGIRAFLKAPDAPAPVPAAEPATEPQEDPLKPARRTRLLEIAAELKAMADES